MLIDGASGGVGAVAVQIAVARGATVVATAGEANQDYLREIRAVPILYGDGLAERVAGTGAGPLDGVLDVAGQTPITDLTALVSDPAQVVSIANFGAAEAGARVTTGGEGDKRAALAEAARLLEQQSAGDQGADVPAGPGGRGLPDDPVRSHPRQDRAAALRSAR